MRNCPLKGKVTLKTLATLKIVYLAMFATLPKSISDEVKKIKIAFTVK